MKALRILSAAEQVAEQVAAHLREQLARGMWTGRMPGGDGLAPSLGVGRMTVEAALRQREDEGLQIAGEDRSWKRAEAKIDQGTVIVWHPDIDAPAAVRYAWASDPMGANLVNGEGLPASCFTTE